ncbi:MAG TPA: helix-hairpin-helix domain-containing protein [Polyangiales bacterium]
MSTRTFSIPGRSLWSVLLIAAALNLAPHAHAEAAKPAAAAPVAAPAAADGVININTASAEELDRLPGIGPSRAEAIVALRTKLKRFEHLEDLMRVKGIGRATFRKLRPLLRLDGTTTLAGKPGSAHRPAAQH